MISRETIRSAFTQFPYCVATYVCLIGAACLLFMPFRPVRVDPPVYAVANPSDAAKASATALNGRVWAVSNTGSMRPLLQGGEYVVTVSNFDAVQKGQVLVYHATYNKNPIIHRAVDRDKHGWLMAGDTAKHSESWARVTKENYLGTVFFVYKSETLGK